MRHFIMHVRRASRGSAPPLNCGVRRLVKAPIESQPLSEREAFENGYYYFVTAVEILSLPASAQCERMGNYNTAWELKDDVGAGSHLLRSPSSSRLSEAQRAAIVALLAAVAEVPANELPAGDSREANLAAMQHPAWMPLRPKAAALLELLAPATQECKRYLKLGGE